MTIDTVLNHHFIIDHNYWPIKDWINRTIHRKQLCNSKQPMWYRTRKYIYCIIPNNCPLFAILAPRAPIRDNTVLNKSVVKERNGQVKYWIYDSPTNLQKKELYEPPPTLPEKK